MGTVEIRAVEFVEDIADPNNGYFEALKSNQTISSIKAFGFFGRKCKILKISIVGQLQFIVFVRYQT